jgi:hypothetical protein
VLTLPVLELCYAQTGYNNHKYKYTGEVIMKTITWLDDLTNMHLRQAEKVAHEHGFQAYRIEDRYWGMGEYPVPEPVKNFPNIGLYVTVEDEVVSFKLHHNPDSIMEKMPMTQKTVEPIQKPWQDKLVGMKFNKARMLAATNGYFAYYVAPKYLNSEKAPVPTIHSDDPLIGLVVDEHLMVIGHTFQKKNQPVPV